MTKLRINFGFNIGIPTWMGQNRLNICDQFSMQNNDGNVYLVQTFDFLSDCHNSDEINILLNTKRLKKEIPGM